jgi:hypothetical protein
VITRYIDADKFISYLGFENTEEERDENIGEIVTLQDFDNQIAEDVQEIKHGEWLPTNHPEQKRCSVCDAISFIASYPCIYRADYCPNCGAKMDKE